jgi:serine/threonine protein kinase
MTFDPVSKARDPLLGTQIDGRYLVKSVLGRGGMGVVYEGVHEQLGRSVAIKVLSAATSGDPVSVQRFLREAQIAGQLTHGNIVDVQDLGVLPDGRPYLVMAKVLGTDLASLLLQQGRQTPRRVVDLLHGVASALDLVHAKGFVHRDVKPENLMHVVREDGSETTLLLDFGIVGLVSAPSARLTAEGSVFGTPAYLPPEVIQGAPPDRRADVYALATVAFELMAGRPPFESDNPLRILPMKIMEDAPRLGAVCNIQFSTDIQDVLAKGLTREPDDRWTSAGEFVAALDAAVYLEEEAAGLAEPRSRSAAMRRSAVNTGVRGLPGGRPMAPPIAVPQPAGGAFDPVKLEEARQDLALFDSKQIEVAVEASLPPLPPPSKVEVAETSRLELGSPTLSTELLTPSTRIELSKRSSRKAILMGIAAGMVIGLIGLIGFFSARSPERAPAVSETVVRPAPAKPVPQPAPELVLPPPEAAEPNREPQPAAAAVVPAKAPTEPKPAPVAKAPRVRPATTKPAEPVPAARAPTTTKPNVRVSANDLVQAAARELIQGHLSAAADLYTQATRIDPKSEAAFRGLGLVNERMGKKADAIRAFNRALALSPTGQNAAMLRARVAKLQGAP